MSFVNYAIRNANPSDAPAMMSLARQSDTAAHWREQDYERIFHPDAARRTAILLERDNQILGFVVASCAGPEWELENIVVANNERRNGLGQRILTELLKRAKQARAESVFLEVRQSNAAARALYLKRGFAEIAKRKEYYSSPTEDAVVYRRRL